MKIEYQEQIPEWMHNRASCCLRRGADLKNKYIHATTLLQPAHMVSLQDRHHEDIRVKADDLIPSMVGIAWHKFLEGAMPSGGHTERRLTVQRNGWTITGTPDWFSEDRLIDLKTAKVWSYVFGKREWEEQLNVYRWLLFQSLGVSVDRLENHVVYLDWAEGAAKRNPDLPQRRWGIIEQRAWPFEDIGSFIDRRLEALEDPDLCNAEERWERGECFAAMKKNRKTALKRCETREEAEAVIEGVSGGYVEHRPGDPIRCRSWCNVKQFCEYGRAVE